AARDRLEQVGHGGCDTETLDDGRELITAGEQLVGLVDVAMQGARQDAGVGRVVAVGGLGLADVAVEEVGFLVVLVAVVGVLVDQLVVGARLVVEEQVRGVDGRLVEELPRLRLLAHQQVASSSRARSASSSARRAASSSSKVSAARRSLP